MSERFGKDKLITPRVLWAAFLFSQVLYAVVGFMTQPEQAPADPIVNYILAGLGIAVALAAPLVAPLFARSAVAAAKRGGGEIKNPMAVVFTPFLLGMAMREAASIFALVILLQGGDVLLWAGPAALAFIVTAVAYPTARGFENWLQAA